MRPAPARARARAVALAAVLLAAAAGPLVGLAGSAPVARAAAPDLTLVTDATYLVQPARHRILVTVDVTAANHRAETKTSKYYYDHAFLAVQAGAASPKATGLKGAKASIAKADAKATMIRIDFGKRLYGGSAVAVRLTFELDDPGKAAGQLVRVGDSLITFPVWAYASRATPGSRVTVRFPAGYQVSVEAGSFAATTTASDGGTQLATGPITAPLAFYAYVSAQKAPTYTETPLSVDVADGTVVLRMRAWADDPAWTTRIGAAFGRVLPPLRKDIGFAWPYSDPVVVQEALSRSADGHAGTYDTSRAKIEIAYWASDAVIFHEAAHGWFNGRLLADRWAVEGFAAWYARRALIELGSKPAAPALTDAQTAAAIPLNAWTADQAPDPAVEGFGFAASAMLAAAIADRAGADVLQRVWLDAADRTGAYQPPSAAAGTGSFPSVETVDGAPDWRSLLDLLEAESGRDFTDLWRTWVVRPAEAPLLVARAAARADYTLTLGLTDGWALPRSIRDALRAWQFDTAASLMASARSVLAQRTALADHANRSGLVLPNTLRTLFGTGSLEAAAAEADREEAAMLAIDIAAASRTADTDPLSVIGMVGEQPEADLAAATAALAAGQMDHVLPSATRAYQAWTGAWQEGRRRVAFVIALLATVAVLGSSAVSRVHRRSRLRRGDAPATHTA